LAKCEKSFHHGWARILTDQKTIKEFQLKSAFRKSATIRDIRGWPSPAWLSSKICGNLRKSADAFILHGSGMVGGPRVAILQSPAAHGFSLPTFR